MTDFLQTAPSSKDIISSFVPIPPEVSDVLPVKTAGGRVVVDLQKYLSNKPLRSLLRPEASHFAYLQRIFSEGAITPATLETARHVWHLAWRSARRMLRAPACGVGSKGEIICCWDRGTEYLEVEIHESTVEWFYKNRSTRELVDWDLKVDDPELPIELIHKLRLVSY